MRRLPIVKKFDNASMGEQVSKVWEEMAELAEAYAIICRQKEQRKLKRSDITHFAEEAFDVSQAAQQCIHILCKTCGKHYCLTENEVYEKAIAKNQKRGYYDESNKSEKI